ncbi:NAD-dependent succinate-semialdehyde dehydrogenase [Flavobacteriaceae bacterium]|nr:NAD-dependent succinate-semialdehyde dehydrogenase [Flavobacteriaceae bacterium]
MKHDLLFDKSYVNGEWTTEGSASFDVLNPANKEKVATVADGGVPITEKAIKVAHNAFESWQKTTAKYRAAILEKWNDLILEHRDELAKIMTLECGKPIAESKGEVAYGAAFVKWFAEEGKRTYGDVIPPHTEDRRLVVIKQAVGVVAAITPWNFPLAMITRKVAPALAAGCTVIIRPTYETPLTALALAHLAEEAGFPPGVVNVVVGKNSAAMGKVFCESDLVKKISFTGSTRIGQILMEQSAGTLKKLSLELGGNAPFIVFEDADLDKAIAGAIVSKFRNSGQTCVCVNRILVHEKVYDAFTAKLIKAVTALKVGNGLSTGVNIGPMINTKAVESTTAFVEDAQQKGGVILTGGKAIDDCFFEPTVIGNASNEMLFSKEEIFGPVAPIYKFSSDEEAIEMANDTVYGLASYFYSESVSRCWKVAEALEYGMVGINEGLISTEVAPFGGVKFSGHGREGSKYGIEDYLEIKYLCFGNIV